MKNQQSQNTDTISPEILKTELVTKDRENESSGIEFFYREGPILPDELKAYDDLVPGFANQYLTEVINEAKHQRQLELAEVEQEKLILDTQKEIFTSNHKRSLLGTTAGFTVIMTALILATVLGLQGKEKTALGIVGSLAGVSVIIYGTDAYNKGKMQKLEQKKDDKEKILE
jgi:hypothetical protein